MRYSQLLLLFSLSLTQVLALVPPESPTSEKAQESYKEVLDDVHKHRTERLQESRQTGRRALPRLPKENDPVWP
jgi:hypothetical protein